MDSSQEAELIAQAKDNPAAFGRLFDEHYPKIYGYALRRIADPAVAADITAEVFYKALKNLWQFTWQGVPFSAWLYRIAGNEINYYFRAGARHKTISLNVLVEEQGFEIVDPTDLLAELEAAEREVERHAEYLNVQNKLAQLPAKYQEVIALRFFEEKKIGEIALILGKKEGTVKSLLSRGLEKLRERMETMQPSSTLSIITNEGECGSMSPKKL